jgi:hypothetical protein
MTLILGSANFADLFYYAAGNGNGNADYAIIKDLNHGTGTFNSAEGDKLVLKGAGFIGSYQVTSNGVGTNAYSLSIFGEKIAEIQNYTGSIFSIYGSFEYTT